MKLLKALLLALITSNFTVGICCIIWFMEDDGDTVSFLLGMLNIAVAIHTATIRTNLS